MGDKTYIYDSKNYLFSGLHLPAISEVPEASAKSPYLGLSLKFDYTEISQLIADTQLPMPPTQTTESTMATGTLTLPLIDAFERLLGLFNEKENIPILAPLIKREIFFRLLIGKHGNKLRKLATFGTQSQKITQSISWLQSNFAQPLRIDDLAKKANMGVSTYHQHFRQMTNLSPLQYQKQLRLQEARRLMLTQNIDAATAAYEVGYQSPSQFSREYSRLFDAPPASDIINLRERMTSNLY